MSEDCLGFLDHLGIRLEVPVTQFMFQRWKQPEIVWCEVYAVQWMLHQFNFVAFKLLLHKSSRTWLSIILMKNPPAKKFWSFLPDMIKESFQYHFAKLIYPHFWKVSMLIDHPSAIEEGDQHYFAHWLLEIEIRTLTLFNVGSFIFLTFFFLLSNSLGNLSYWSPFVYLHFIFLFNFKVALIRVVLKPLTNW